MRGEAVLVLVMFAFASICWNYSLVPLGQLQFFKKRVCVCVHICVLVCATGMCVVLRRHLVGVTSLSYVFQGLNSGWQDW